MTMRSKTVVYKNAQQAAKQLCERLHRSSSPSRLNNKIVGQATGGFHNSKYFWLVLSSVTEVSPMTLLRQRMLEDLRIRNYAPSIVEYRFCGRSRLDTGASLSSMILRMVDTAAPDACCKRAVACRSPGPR